MLKGRQERIEVVDEIGGKRGEGGRCAEGSDVEGKEKWREECILTEASRLREQGDPGRGGDIPLDLRKQTSRRELVS